MASVVTKNVDPASIPTPSSGKTAFGTTLTSDVFIKDDTGAVTILTSGGTVTSVAVSSTNGTISVSGSPITESGTIDLDVDEANLDLASIGGSLSLSTQVTGTLPIANGGTGASTASGALTALLPSQTSQSGKVLGTNGTSASWVSAMAPGGVTGSVQYRSSSGTFAGTSSFFDNGIFSYDPLFGATVKAVDNTRSTLRLVSVGDGSDFPELRFTKSGYEFAPSNPAFDEPIQGAIFRITAEGSTGTAYSTGATIQCNATSPWSATNTGTSLLFNLTQNNTTTLTQVLQMSVSAGASVFALGGTGSTFTFGASGITFTSGSPCATINVGTASSAGTDLTRRSEFTGSGNLVAPRYESITATAGQTVLNTTVSTIANSAGKSYLQVFLNGVLQREGAGKAYTVTGSTQIQFNSGLALNDEVDIYSFA